MASTKFEISKKDRNGASELMVRFCYDRKHSYRLHTLIWVPQTAWNASKGRLIIPRIQGKEQKHLSQLQAQVDDLSAYLKSKCIEAPMSADKDYWTQKVKEFHNQGQPMTNSPLTKEEDEIDLGEDVIDAFTAFINTKVTNAKTKEQMEVAKRTVKRYTLYVKRELRLKEWTSADLADYQHFLQIEHTFFDEKGKCKRKYQYIYKASPSRHPQKPRGGNAIFALMKKLRTMFNWCVKTGRLNESPFRTFQLQGCVYGTPFYMTIDELNTLYHFDFSRRPKLAIQRDIFVLQSNLGMRIADFYGLTTANIVGEAIEYIPGKTLHDTGDVVRVPLTERAKEIINRYHADDSSISLMPFISEQKYNDAIKDMLRLAGINRIVTILNPTTRLEEKHPICEKASSHMARRNFIGNLYRVVQDPAVISSMTGHKPGSRAFERYRAIQDDIKKPLLKIFD